MGRKRLDIVGREFGKLEVISNIPNRPGYVGCKCSCGNIKIIRANTLTRTVSPVRSCGCLAREKASINGRKVIKQNSAKRLELIRKYGTNFDWIENQKLSPKNKSGKTGVWQDQHGGWVVHIGVNGENKYLGRYSSYEEAVGVRVAAEEEYYKPLIEAKNAELR